MTLLKGRFLYLKVWNRGFYLALGRPVSDNAGDYIVRFWFNLPKKKSKKLDIYTYKVK